MKYSKILLLALSLVALPAHAELNDIKKVPASNVDWRVSQPVCFLVDQKDQLADLLALCGKVAAPSIVILGGVNYIPSGFGASGSGSTNVCQYSTDRAADGSLCGARAASQRPGG